MTDIELVKMYEDAYKLAHKTDLDIMLQDNEWFVVRRKCASIGRFKTIKELNAFITGIRYGIEKCLFLKENTNG